MKHIRASELHAHICMFVCVQAFVPDPTTTTIVEVVRNEGAFVADRLSPMHTDVCVCVFRIFECVFAVLNVI